MLLQNEIAVVTGGASERGIGRAIAKLFAEHGAKIAVLDIDGARAKNLAESLGEAHRGFPCDVTQKQNINTAVASVVREIGRPSILVNNAGITQPNRIAEISEADYDSVVDINLKGTFLCSQIVLPHMRALGRGSIISISSVAAKRGGGIFGSAHYSASKAGILGLVRAMARELAPEGIRVNAIAPGLIDTDMTKGQLTQEMKAEIAGTVPMKRIGQPIDVAKACLFFASELSGYVTGEVMDVNGGMHID